MNQRWRFHAVAALILSASILANLSFVPTLLSKQAFQGGYTREILFVKDQSGTTGGYFIIIDDIFRSKPLPVDMLLHGIGDLVVQGNECTWTTSSNVSLLARVLHPASVSISAHEGWYAQARDYIPYVKIRPDVNATRVVTLLYPYNSTIPVPATTITSCDHGMVRVDIGNGSTLLFHEDHLNVPAHSPVGIDGTNFSGDYLYHGPGGMLANDATVLEINGTTVYNSSVRASIGVMPGTFDAIALQQASNFMPVEHPTWTIEKSAISDLLAGDHDHPFLYFNDSYKPTLVARCATTDPWKSWYQAFLGQVPTWDSYNLTGKGIYDRSRAAESLAFHAYMEGNQSSADAAINILLHMDEMDAVYPQHLERSNCIADYAFAFDLVYDFMNETTIDRVKLLLDQGARPLFTNMYHSAANNWRVVMSDGLALAGFMTGNADYVWTADDQLNWYLERDRTRAEGGVFEGQVYAGYTWTYGLRVAELFRYHGLRDYFQDPRLAATVNFTVLSITPNGYYPMFEDCSYSLGTNTINGIYASRFNDAGFTGLAQHMRWTNAFHGDFFTRYYGIRPLVFYDYNVSASTPSIGAHGSIVFPDSDIACLRDGLETTSTYLTISSKDYPQSHVHYDENSIEIFALGEKLLTNPGYPGWGKDHHLNWTIFSNASNCYLFDGRGQTQKTSSGITEWLLLENLNYISCDGSSLYSDFMFL